MKKVFVTLSLFGTLAGAGAIFAGCKKSTEDKNSITKEHLVGSYKLTSLLYSTGGYSIDYAVIMDTCRRDDLYKLNGDMSMNRVDAGTVCSPATSFTSTWQLDNKKITLVLPTQIDTLRGTVTKYDGRELDIVEDTISNNTAFKISATLMKQ
jgi:hypothetical protein